MNKKTKSLVVPLLAAVTLASTAVVIATPKIRDYCAHEAQIRSSKEIWGFYQDSLKSALEKEDSLLIKLKSGTLADYTKQQVDYYGADAQNEVNESITLLLEARQSNPSNPYINRNIDGMMWDIFDGESRSLMVLMDVPSEGLLPPTTPSFRKFCVERDKHYWNLGDLTNDLSDNYFKLSRHYGDLQHRSQIGEFREDTPAHLKKYMKNPDV
jgi:hypothetical protein